MVGSILFAWMQGYGHFHLHHYAYSQIGFLNSCNVMTGLQLQDKCFYKISVKLVKAFLLCLFRSNLDCDAKKWR